MSDTAERDTKCGVCGTYYYSGSITNSTCPGVIPHKWQSENAALRAKLADARETLKIEAHDSQVTAGCPFCNRCSCGSTTWTAPEVCPCTYWARGFDGEGFESDGIGGHHPKCDGTGKWKALAPEVCECGHEVKNGQSGGYCETWVADNTMCLCDDHKADTAEREGETE